MTYFYIFNHFLFRSPANKDLFEDLRFGFNKPEMTPDMKKIQSEIIDILKQPTKKHQKEIKSQKSDGEDEKGEVLCMFKCADDSF